MFTNKSGRQSLFNGAFRIDMDPGSVALHRTIPMDVSREMWHSKDDIDTMVFLELIKSSSMKELQAIKSYVERELRKEYSSNKFHIYSISNSTFGCFIWAQACMVDNTDKVPTCNYLNKCCFSNRSISPRSLSENSKVYINTKEINLKNKTIEMAFSAQSKIILSYPLNKIKYNKLYEEIILNKSKITYSEQTLATASQKKVFAKGGFLRSKPKVLDSDISIEKDKITVADKNISIETSIAISKNTTSNESQIDVSILKHKIVKSSDATRSNMRSRSMSKSLSENKEYPVLNTADKDDERGQEWFKKCLTGQFSKNIQFTHKVSVFYKKMATIDTDLIMYYMRPIELDDDLNFFQAASSFELIDFSRCRN